MGGAVLCLALLVISSCWIWGDASESSVIGVSDVAIAILDSDSGSPDFETTLKFESKESGTLSATHLQKLKLSFKLTTPDGKPFTAHQVFLRLGHDGYDQLFVVKPAKKGYELVLDFLGLVEELHYFSGQYNLELLVGDAKMANSFLWNLGTLELDLPEAPEGKGRPASKPDTFATFGPKPEISHIFRTPEKRPSTTVSYTFLALTLLPLLGFLAGLITLNVNLENLPKSGMPAISALAFHLLLAAIMGLYALFWLKFDLFYTLRVLGFLGVLTMIAGYKLLSHLADASSKVKVA